MSRRRLTGKQRWKQMAMSVFARVLAPMFVSFPRLRSRSSIPQFRLPQDGTDPLLGGHGAAPAGRRRVGGGRQGGAS